MNRKSVIILVGLLVIALAVVGVGYGLWFEDLLIKGTVTTGVLDLGYSPFTLYEWFSNAADEPIATQEGGVPPLNVPELNAALFHIKDNVECYAEFTGPNGADSPEPGVDTGYDGLLVRVTGAYPSYSCLVYFDITNLGTVPVILGEWEGDIYPYATTPVCVDTGVPEIGYIQLHQGESADCWTRIHFTNEDNLDENQTYEFWWTIRGYQWNEYPWPVVD